MDKQHGEDPVAWTVRIGSTAVDAVTVFVRKHQYTVGAPIQFDGEYPRVTALEYMLGAIGADVVNGVRSVARKRRVAVENVEALIRGTLNNPLTYLGVIGETGHSGIETIEIRVYVSSLAETDALQQVWEEALNKSPLIRTLAPLIRLTLEMKPII